MRFDPYSEWLGVPVGPRPPHPYALLGLPPFERDTDRIVAAADARMRQVRHQAPFDRIAESQRLLQEIRSAKELLTDPERRRRLELKLRRGEKRFVAGSRMTGSAAAQAPSEPPASASRFRMIGAASALVATGLLGVGLLIAWLVPDHPAFDSSTANGGAASTDEPPVKVATPVETALSDVPPKSTPITKVAQVPKALQRAPLVAVKPAEAQAVAHSAARPVPTFLPLEAPRPLIRSLAGYRLPEFATAGDANAYAEQVRQLLTEGFVFQGGELNAALDHHRTATTLADDTALADYAMGLAYWKRLRFDDAVDRLEASRGTIEIPHLPAWQALIQLHLKRSQREAAFGEAREFAKALARIDGEQELNRARDDSLRWLGRLTAALESPWQKGTFPSQDVIDMDAAIRDALGTELVEVYERGRRSLRDDFAVHVEEVQAEIERITAAHAKKQSQELESISADRDAAGDKQAKMARTAAEWDKHLREETDKIDEQLEKLTPQYQQLSVQAEAAWSTLAVINEQITLELEVPADQRPDTSRYGSATLLAAREQAVVRYRVAAGKAAEVRRQAEMLVARRRAVTGEYERATQKLASESDTLKKWDGVLRRRATKAETAEAEDTPAVRALRRRSQEITTYVPFDLEAERETILKVLDEAGAAG